MRVLLINPNRYKAPPVPPIGLEYIAGHMKDRGHEVEILDLCFADNPVAELDNSFKEFLPDVAGLTVRNVDTVLYHTNEFFLDDIREIVQHVKSNYGTKVVIGGTGVMTNPEGVMEYINADFAIAGPAEGSIDEWINEMQNSPVSGKVFRGKNASNPQCRRMTGKTDYKKYFDSGGIAGFETHKGCSSSCVYCLEANSSVRIKKIENVISEIKDIVGMGYGDFHLCDSEFNEDIDYCTEFLNELKRSGLNIKWALYMKPSNHNRQLFRLMKDAGVSLITLTVDSWKKCPLYYEDIEKIVFSAKSAGINIFVDFLTGFPYEGEDTLLWHLDFFRRIMPDIVNINTYIRLYKSLQISNIVMNDPNLKTNLLGNIEDTSFIKPVFYNHLTNDRLKNIIRGESLFRIEGIEKGVNYTRANQ